MTTDTNPGTEPRRGKALAKYSRLTLIAFSAKGTLTLGLILAKGSLVGTWIDKLPAEAQFALFTSVMALFLVAGLRWCPALFFRPRSGTCPVPHTRPGESRD